MMGSGMSTGIEGPIGYRFGRLVLESAHKYRNGRPQATFQCDCGAVVVKVLTKVKNGQTKSCGCLKEKSRRATPPEKMIGRRFHRLLIVSQAPTVNHATRWVCLCDCGVRKTVTTHNLMNGSTKSCGCFSRDQMSSIGRRNNGKRANNWLGIGEISKSYWSNILNGANVRGLDVTVSLQDIRELFLSQGRKCALTNMPIQFAPVGERVGTASLDRIDSSKGYISGNIQWVDKRVQQMKWDMGQPEFFDLCCLVAAKSYIVGA